MRKQLTENQKNVLAIMRSEKVDLRWVAQATEEAWKNGESYYIDTRCRCPRGLRAKFKLGNKEATGE